MKQIAVKLEYKEKVFTSEYNTYNEEEEKCLNEMIVNIASGRVNYYQFDTKTATHFFPSKVLEESIITLLYRSETPSE